MMSSLFGTGDSKTILNTLEGYPSAQLLLKTLKDPRYADISALLDAAGTKTFFCPVNETLIEIEMGNKHFGANLDDLVRDMLSCHIVMDKAVSSKDAPCFLENSCKNPQWVNKGGKGQMMHWTTGKTGLAINFGIPGWPMWTADVSCNVVPCSNGNLYFISKVLRFAYSMSTMAKLQGQGISFRYCLEDYGLNTLSNCFTNISVFMPKSEAVDKLVSDNLGPELVRDTLMAHHVKGCLFSDQLKDGMKLETFSGHGLTVSVDSEGCVSINGVRVIVSDVITKNGVIHFIDAVLPLDKLPQDESKLEGFSLRSS